MNVDDLYICPLCKLALVDGNCANCDFKTAWVNNDIPIFFTNTEICDHYKEIGLFYDDLYENVSNTWQEIASRGPDFIKYIAYLIPQKAFRYLDIGCGEGQQIASVNAPEKYGLDISKKAALIASEYSNSHICVGVSEQLPYPSNYFDVITSIGVLTHIIDPELALKEMRRVLKDDGALILGVFFKIDFMSRLIYKISELLLPYPKPKLIINYISTKFPNKKKLNHHQRRYKQPVETHFSSKQLDHLFKNSNFKVSKLITKHEYPGLPIAGHNFRIYILK